MNYELARQLRDAGYPQTGLMYTWYYSTKPMGVHNSGEKYLDVENHPERIVIPTLTELIEACGLQFGKLERIAGLAWSAFNSDGDPITPPISAKGSTPEEAVAKLWLTLTLPATTNE